MDVVWEWFQWLNSEHGIKLTIFYDEWDRNRFFGGIWTTIHLSLVCMALSIVIGMGGAWLQMSKFIWIRRIVQGYIQFFRNTPPLVQLYFFYFAVDSALASVTGIEGGVFSSYGWAVISLSFLLVLLMWRFSVLALNQCLNQWLKLQTRLASLVFKCFVM